jgi:hypothetical protein
MARKSVRPAGFFPKEASVTTFAPDTVQEKVYSPIYQRFCDLAGLMKHLQDGKLQAYVLYIAVTLIALLIWKLR